MQIFKFGFNAPLTPILALGSTSPKNWLLGSKWVHRHPYCGVLWCKRQSFNLVSKAPSAKIWPQGPNPPKNWLLGSRGVHRHPWCRVLWQQCRFSNLFPKAPQTQNLAPGVQIFAKLVAGVSHRAMFKLGGKNYLCSVSWLRICQLFTVRNFQCWIAAIWGSVKVHIGASLMTHSIL